jgi:hypothetical protein
MPSERFDYYLNQCKIHHVTKKTFSGNGVLKHLKRIVSFSQSLGAKSALDYGCGKGLQYEKQMHTGLTFEQTLGYQVTKYDPAVEKFWNKPAPGSKFDLVWCTDVLEHVPAEDIDWVIDDLVSFASKGLFITVGTYPAKKRLPNGENAHVCIKPGEWWIEKFARVDSVRIDLLVE